MGYTLEELHDLIEDAAQNGDDMGMDVSFADDLLNTRYINELYDKLEKASGSDLDDLAGYATHTLFDALTQTFGTRYI